VSDTRSMRGTPPSAEADAVQGRVDPIWDRSEIGTWMGFWQETHQPTASCDTIADMRPALVDHRLFPHATFRQVMARGLRRLETTPSASKSPQGNQGNGQLRRAIAEHVSLTRALACGADDIIVTSGAQ